MSSTVIIDLTDDVGDVGSKRLRTRDAEIEVWVVIYQLETGGYGSIWDWEEDRHRSCASHNPTRFDSDIRGIFRSRSDANRKALAVCHEKDLEITDGDEDDKDFVGEGVFKSGQDSGDVNTFSERVFVKREIVK